MMNLSLQSHQISTTPVPVQSIPLPYDPRPQAVWDRLLRVEVQPLEIIARVDLCSQDHHCLLFLGELQSTIDSTKRLHRLSVGVCYCCCSSVSLRMKRLDIRNQKCMRRSVNNPLENLPISRLPKELDELEQVRAHRVTIAAAGEPIRDSLRVRRARTTRLADPLDHQPGKVAAEEHLVAGPEPLLLLILIVEDEVGELSA